MSLILECIHDSLPIWEACLHTPFLHSMADGTLDEACLKGYIVEDSLYLREYARVFAWGMLHAPTMQEIRMFYTMLSFVKESEDAVRLKYLRRWGITDEEIQLLPLRKENQAYVNTMLEAAQSGSGAVCLMAALPCMLSYAWIFERMFREHESIAETLCGPLVREYASPEYAQLCRVWMEDAWRICEPLNAEQKQRCKEIFRACSEHELRFWRMSGSPREDI